MDWGTVHTNLEFQQTPYHIPTSIHNSKESHWLSFSRVCSQHYSYNKENCRSVSTLSRIVLIFNQRRPSFICLGQEGWKK